MLSGIARIDDLYEGVAGATPITATDSPDVIAAIQDLIRGHGKKHVPTFRDTKSYGTLGAATKRGLLELQRAWRLRSDPKQPQVDRDTLLALVKQPHRNPIAARVYVTMCLDRPWDEKARILSYVSNFEGRSRFTVYQTNIDNAGFAFGLIQWTQKPGRLAQIMDALNAASRSRCLTIFGGEARWDGARAQARKPHGGVDEHDGTTPAADRAFDFTLSPWPARFQASARDVTLIKAQFDTAVTDFDGYIQTIRGYWPDIASVRARAFMLDLVNQFGGAGARRLFATANAADEPDERARLVKINVAALDLVKRKFKLNSQIYRSTKDRRDWFCDSALLNP